MMTLTISMIMRQISSTNEVDYGTSSIYTQKDMEDAVKVIKRKFKHMKGFELHKVYFVDDEFSESTLQAVNEKGKKQGWTLARSDGGKWRIISEGY
jgi:uncharacterized lipoprotein YehR (DUF1307 family)